jgi:hypothetical protein
MMVITLALVSMIKAPIATDTPILFGDFESFILSNPYNLQDSINNTQNQYIYHQI